MQKAHVLMFGAGLLLAAGTAFADGDPAEAGAGAAAGASAGADANGGGAGAGAGAGAAVGTGAGTAGGVVAEAPAPKIWVGGGLEMSPVGSFSSSAGGMSSSADADLNYGLDVVALYQVHPMVAVGIAPRYVLGIKPKNATGDSASMYDIRAVGVVGKDVSPKIRLMGMAGLGYASIAIPDQAGMSSPSAAGMTLSFAGGAGYALGAKLMATAMLSYELGFQSVDVGGQSADFHFNHLIVGLGILAAIK